MFIFTENLTDDIDDKKIAIAAKEPEPGTGKQTPNPVPLLKEAFTMSEGEDGWAHLGVMGVNLRQLDPSFDPRTFGYGQLLQLIKAHKDLFTIRQEDDKGPSAVYVKREDKRRSHPKKKKPEPQV